MEPVNFQGVKVVEIEATQDMLISKSFEEYRKAPYMTLQLNLQATSSVPL